MGKSRISVITHDRIEVRGFDLASELIGKISFTDMFILQTTGTKPTMLQRALIEAVMVAIMEHGVVPSIVASRLTLLGAPESLQGAVAAGLLGVGDRFAGTASECAKILQQIAYSAPADKVKIAAAIVSDHRARKKPVPGFGHPNHKGGDPRYSSLMSVAREAGAEGLYLNACDILHDAVKASAGKPIPTNVSLAIGAVLGESRLPIAIFRGVVLVARCAGLVGHLAEEMVDPVGNDMWKAAENVVAVID